VIGAEIGVPVVTGVANRSPPADVAVLVRWTTTTT
jgi:hypothetical protein